MIPGDIAAAIINLMNFVDGNPVVKGRMVFCPEPHSVDRYDDFKQKLIDKFNEKFYDGDIPPHIDVRLV